MAKDPLIEIGSFIRAAREQQNLAVENLASLSRVSIHHIENIEAGNRTLLPEEAYLIGFLNSLLRALKVDNYNDHIENFKKRESQFILQSIVDHNFDQSLQEQKNKNKLYFKVYHIYTILILFFVTAAFFVLAQNKSFKAVEFPILIKPKPHKDVSLLLAKQAEPLENGSGLIENGTALDSVNGQKMLPANGAELQATQKTNGQVKLSITVKEPAWYQVIGVKSQKVLFEGDVLPVNIPGSFNFQDEEGFVLATGNAGAFQINTSKGNFMLGRSGKLIRWFYPESAKAIYLSKTEPAKPKPQAVQPVVVKNDDDDKDDDEKEKKEDKKKGKR